MYLTDADDFRPLINEDGDLDMASENLECMKDAHITGEQDDSSFNMFEGPSR